MIYLSLFLLGIFGAFLITDEFNWNTFINGTGIGLFLVILTYLLNILTL